jgi:ligand-binding sensor domain-containing protein
MKYHQRQRMKPALFYALTIICLLSFGCKKNPDKKDLQAHDGLSKELRMEMYLFYQTAYAIADIVIEEQKPYAPEKSVEYASNLVLEAYNTHVFTIGDILQEGESMHWDSLAQTQEYAFSTAAVCTEAGSKGRMPTIEEIKRLVMSKVSHGWTTYTTSDGLIDNEVKAITIASDQSIWFGTAHGVSHYNGTSWASYTTQNGLAHDNVQAIEETPDGVLWFGTYNGGVSRFDGTAWKSYTQEDGLASNVVYSIVKTSRGMLWFATPSGVSKFDGKTWHTYTEKDGLIDTYVWSIAVDSDDVLWFGTQKGLSRFDGKEWRSYATPLEGRKDIVSIVLTPEGLLWCGTWMDGVLCFDKKEWRQYTREDGLADNQVLPISVAPDGKLWVGTQGGVSCFDGQFWTTYTSNTGLADNKVLSSAVDHEGGIWFGTQGGGVSHYMP